MKRKTLVSAVITCSVLATMPALSFTAHAQDESDTDQIVSRAYYSGNGFLNRGLYDLAAAEYRKVLEMDPDHEHAPRARYGLGVCHFRQGEFEQAIETLTPLREQRTFVYAAETRMILGQSYVALGEYDNAVEQLRVVVERHQSHGLADDAAAVRAEALYLARHYRQAEEAALKAINTWPDSSRRDRTELFWALSAAATDRHKLAAERFDALIRRNPDGAYADQATLLLAQSLHRSEKIDESIEQYETILDRTDSAFHADALYGLALVEHQRDRFQRADTLLTEFEERFEEHDLVPNATLLHGRVWFDMEEYDRAKRAFTTLSSAGKSFHDDAEYWLAKCDIRAGSPDAAASRLAKAIEAHPKSPLRPEMIYDRAVALQRAGETDTAGNLLSSFLSEYENHALTPGAMHLQAAMLHEARDYDRCLDVCAAFREQFPRHDLRDDIDFLAAESRFLAADYEGAAQSYRQFLENHGDAPQRESAQYRLGMSLYHVGEFEQAEQLLAAVVNGESTAEAFRTSLLALGDGHFQRREWAKAEQYLNDYLNDQFNQSQADDALLKLGIARHRQTKYDSALAAFDILLDRFDESRHAAQALFEKGQTLRAMQQPERANQAFASVVNDFSESQFAVHALNNLGASAFDAGEYENAAGYFTRVAAQAEDDALIADALFQLAQTRMALRAYDAASETLADLLERFPRHERHAHATVLSAIASARQDQHEQALAMIENVDIEDLASVEASLVSAMLYERAWAHRALEHTSETIAAYRELLEFVDPDEPLRFRSMLELAELHAEADNRAEAIALLRTMRDAGIDHGIAAESRGQGLYRLGVLELQDEQFDRSRATLESFLKQFPETETAASARLLIGEAAYETGAHRTAVENLREVIASHKDADEYPVALLRYAEALAALQEWNNAEQAFSQYLDEFPESRQWFQAQFGKAWALENAGSLDSAIEAYRVVVDRHKGPTAARAQFQIGECLFGQGKHQEAVAELLKVDILYAYPEWSAAALYEAARCFVQLGNPAQARRHFEQVQEEYPDTEWAALAKAQLAELSKTSLPGHDRDGDGRQNRRSGDRD